MTKARLHALEREYNLSKDELLDAMSRRFRARVTLEGAVAEVHLGKHLARLKRAGTIREFEAHDRDGYPDYTITMPDRREFRIECKNVRDSEEAYRKDGEVVAYKVETQKTRSSKGDATSRFYSYDQFEVLAVCLGKKTHDWTQFMFILSTDLTEHRTHKGKMAVMHRVPLPTSSVEAPWYASLEGLVRSL